MCNTLLSCSLGKCGLGDCLYSRLEMQVPYIKQLKGTVVNLVLKILDLSTYAVQTLYLSDFRQFELCRMRNLEESTHKILFVRIKKKFNIYLSKKKKF